VEHSGAGDQAQPDRHEAYQKRHARRGEKRARPGLPAEAKLRNFSAFDLALNHAVAAAAPALSRAG